MENIIVKMNFDKTNIGLDLSISNGDGCRCWKNKNKNLEYLNEAL